MRTLLLSDIHADPAALDGVLADAGRHGWDRLVLLGDVVGYGDDALTTIDTLRALDPHAAVLGNHEAMLFALLDGENVAAAPGVVAALERQAAALTPAALAFLRGFEPSHLEPRWAAVHGALRRPWEYLISVPVVRANEAFMERPLTFVGHTHIPAAFVKRAAGEPWRVNVFKGREGYLSVPEGEGAKAFLNPGSVGRPRDGLAGSSYAIYDEPAGLFEVYRLGL